jgi:hypothetical protein
VSKASATLSSTQRKLPVTQHLPLAAVEDSGVARIDHDEAAAAQVPAETEPQTFVAVDLAVGAVGQLDQKRPAVAVGGQCLAVVLVGGEFARAQVAQMLIDPVGPQARANSVAPPRFRVHLGTPRRGGVPVVADVVVVENHPGRQRREDPADLRIAPGMAVEALVLGEADDLVGRSAIGRAPDRGSAAREVTTRFRRQLVGVHLVAQQQQRVGQALERQRGQTGGVAVQRVETQFVVELGVAGLGISA